MGNAGKEAPQLAPEGVDGQPLDRQQAVPKGETPRGLSPDTKNDPGVREGFGEFEEGMDAVARRHGVSVSGEPPTQPAIASNTGFSGQADLTAPPRDFSEEATLIGKKLKREYSGGIYGDWGINVSPVFDGVSIIVGNGFPRPEAAEQFERSLQRQPGVSEVESQEDSEGRRAYLVKFAQQPAPSLEEVPVPELTEPDESPALSQAEIDALLAKYVVERQEELTPEMQAAEVLNFNLPILFGKGLKDETRQEILSRYSAFAAEQIDESFEFEIVNGELRSSSEYFEAKGSVSYRELVNSVARGVEVPGNERYGLSILYNVLVSELERVAEDIKPEDLTHVVDISHSLFALHTLFSNQEELAKLKEDNEPYVRELIRKCTKGVPAEELERVEQKLRGVTQTKEDIDKAHGIEIAGLETDLVEKQKELDAAYGVINGLKGRVEEQNGVIAGQGKEIGELKARIAELQDRERAGQTGSSASSVDAALMGQTLETVITYLSEGKGVIEALPKDQLDILQKTIGYGGIAQLVSLIGRKSMTQEEANRLEQLGYLLPALQALAEGKPIPPEMVAKLQGESSDIVSSLVQRLRSEQSSQTDNESDEGSKARVVITPEQVENLHKELQLGKTTIDFAKAMEILEDPTNLKGVDVLAEVFVRLGLDIEAENLPKDPFEGVEFWTQVFSRYARALSLAVHPDTLGESSPLAKLATKLVKISPEEVTAIAGKLIKKEQRRHKI